MRNPGRPFFRHLRTDSPVRLFRTSGLRALQILPMVAILASSVFAAQATGARHRLPDSIAPIDGVRAWVVRKSLSDAERAAPMDFVVGLRLRRFDELQARIHARGQVAHAEMEAKYLPLKEDYDRVTAWLLGQGFTLTLNDPGHANVFVRGTVSAVAGAFDVEFARVATSDGEFTSAVGTAARPGPAIPAEFADVVLGIDGLQPHIRMHVPKARSDEASEVSGFFTPADILAAYQAPSGYDGAGQTIAIIMAAVPLASDLSSFYQACLISGPSNFTTIAVDGGPTAASQSSAADEATLDTEWASGIAPGSPLRLYAIPDLFSNHLIAAVTQIIADHGTDPSLTVASYSASGRESDSSRSSLLMDSQTFARAAAAGITFLAASGDGGSNPYPVSSGNGYNPANPLAVEYPASDPNATGVGGTTLTFTPGWAFQAESAWTPGSLGTGGGISQVFPKPSWQAGAGVPAASFRCVPDIAVVANGAIGSVAELGAVIVLNGQVAGRIGTSLSSPIMAGFMAIANQYRATCGLSSLGLLGPWIYPLIGQAGIRDITTGNNGAYAAGPGYDLCTGVGTPILGVLAGETVTALLASIPAPSGAVNAGTPVTLSVTPQLLATYQWQLNGIDIPGATHSSYTVLAGAADEGAYTVLATFTTLQMTSEYTLGTLSVASDARIVNLSARADAGGGADLIDAGFVVTGPASAVKQVLIRGIGPQLLQYGVPGALLAPDLVLFDAASDAIAANTAWGGSAALATAMAEVGAFSLPPASLDAALLESLAPGSYTAEVSGVGGTTGVALAEIYDVSYTTDGARLVNISARADVETGPNALIAGFVIGAGPTGADETVLVRADGPALASAGVAGVLANPVLTIYDAQNNVVATDAGWGNPPSMGNSSVKAGVEGATAAVASRVGAFPWTAGSADSAVVLTLPPGGYTAQVTGADGSSGLALAEIYEVR